MATVILAADRLTRTHVYYRSSFSLLEKHLRPGADVFEIGAGNEYTANEVARRGYRVVGIDLSAEGARIAVEHYPHAGIIQASIYGDLSGQEGRYDFV